MDTSTGLCISLYNDYYLYQVKKNNQTFEYLIKMGCILFSLPLIINILFYNYFENKNQSQYKNKSNSLGYEIRWMDRRRVPKEVSIRFWGEVSGIFPPLERIT